MHDRGNEVLGNLPRVTSASMLMRNEREDAGRLVLFSDIRILVEERLEALLGDVDHQVLAVELGLAAEA
jgi:hypothetical protein